MVVLTHYQRALAGIISIPEQVIHIDLEKQSEELFLKVEVNGKGKRAKLDYSNEGVLVFVSLTADLASHQGFPISTLSKKQKETLQDALNEDLKEICKMPQIADVSEISHDFQLILGRKLVRAVNPVVSQTSYFKRLCSIPEIQRIYLDTDGDVRLWDIRDRLPGLEFESANKIMKEVLTDEIETGGFKPMELADEFGIEVDRLISQYKSKGQRNFEIYSFVLAKKTSPYFGHFTAALLILDAGEATVFGMDSLFDTGIQPIVNKILRSNVKHNFKIVHLNAPKQFITGTCAVHAMVNSLTFRDLALEQHRKELGERMFNAARACTFQPHEEIQQIPIPCSLDL